MEWKWSDLEIGDKLKMSKEVLKLEESKGHKDWSDYWKKKVFEIIKLYLYPGENVEITISARNMYGMRRTTYNINEITGCYFSDTVPMFEIVELRKDS